jgi:hypothetical protein
VIETLEELLEAIQGQRLTERRAPNVELKKSWDQEDGKKISAFTNRFTSSPHWICVGIADDGLLCAQSESWAKKTEEIISQHINKYLDPQIACLGVSCHECGSLLEQRRIQGRWDNNRTDATGRDNATYRRTPGSY